MNKNRDTKEDLLLKSQELKRQADEILKDSDVVEIFSSYGEVRLVGSYALDVMSRPDLDIYVLTDEHNYEKLMSILGSVFSKNYFQQVCFANWLDTPRESGIIGYYLEPKVNIGKNRWKLDIWFMVRDQYKSYTEKFLELLTKDNPDEKRLTILELKNHYKDGEKYKGNINGKLIYKAVLEHGVKNYQEFEKYLKTTK